MKNFIQSTLISEKVSSNSKEAFELFESQRFGEKTDEKIFYTIYEAYYLVQTKKMEIFDSKEKKISERDLAKKLEKLDKKFKNK